jgi:hypothetical protein
LSGIAVGVPAELYAVKVCVVLLAAPVGTRRNVAEFNDPRHDTFCKNEIEKLTCTVVGLPVPVSAEPNEFPDPERTDDDVPATTLVTGI